MRSGLPIYWCPCMPRNHRDATYWKFAHKDVLPSAPEPLQRFFIYALQQVPPTEIDPQAALKMNLRPWQQLVMRMQREMWSTASFLDAAGRSIYRKGGRYIAAHEPPDGFQRVEVYEFVPARVGHRRQGNDEGRV